MADENKTEAPNKVQTPSLAALVERIEALTQRVKHLEDAFGEVLR